MSKSGAILSLGTSQPAQKRGSAHQDHESLPGRDHDGHRDPIGAPKPPAQKRTSEEPS